MEKYIKFKNDARLLIPKINIMRYKIKRLRLKVPRKHVKIKGNSSDMVS